MASNYGINEPLTKDRYEQTLDNALSDGRLNPESYARLLAEIEHKAREEEKARYAAEDLNLRATDTVIQTRGETRLFRPGAKLGPEVIAQATLGNEPPRLTVYASRGGGSDMGVRFIGGEYYDQGTYAYLKGLMRKDLRLGEALRNYLDNAETDDPIAQAIADNTIEVRYEMIESHPQNGEIYSTVFKLEPPLGLPPIPDAPLD